MQCMGYVFGGYSCMCVRICVCLMLMLNVECVYVCLMYATPCHMLIIISFIFSILDKAMADVDARIVAYEERMAKMKKDLTKYIAR